MQHITVNTANIAHFGDLARRGSSQGASSGERTAYRLAKALHDIGDDMMLLDADAVSGFATLCSLASGPFHTDEQKSLVFDIIARATGI